MNKLHSAKGSALLEFVLFAGVMVPVIILLPSLAATSESNHVSNQAARYGAWEQTLLRKDQATLQKEIGSRFYPATKKNNDDFELIVDVNESGLGGISGTVEKIVHTLGKTIGSVVPDSQWDFTGGGLVSVSVAMQRNKLAVDDKDQACTSEQPCMLHRSAILVDSWGASGPGQVEQRVRSLVPAGVLRPVGDTVAKIGKILPMFQELEKLDGAFGEVRPDVLPSNRVSDKP